MFSLIHALQSQTGLRSPGLIFQTITYAQNRAWKKHVPLTKPKLWSNLIEPTYDELLYDCEEFGYVEMGSSLFDKHPNLQHEAQQIHEHLSDWKRVYKNPSQIMLNILGLMLFSLVFQYF